MPLGKGCAETLNKASMLNFKAISDLYKKSLPVSYILPPPNLNYTLYKEHLWVKAVKYFSKVRCLWDPVLDYNFSVWPSLTQTLLLLVCNRCEAILDLVFKSIFSRSLWIFLVGRIFSLPLAQHCSEFTKRILVGRRLAVFYKYKCQGHSRPV